MRAQEGRPLLLRWPCHTRERWNSAFSRPGLAAAGVLLLFVIVIAALLRATTWEETRTVLDLFVPVVTALIGAMAGFYFAERRER